MFLSIPFEVIVCFLVLFFNFIFCIICYVIREHLDEKKRKEEEKKKKEEEIKKEGGIKRETE
jgi:hypothetical protein